MSFFAKGDCQTSRASRFQPCQIVCLEHETSRLYAEVVQIAEKRQLCWVRPLVLVMQPEDNLSQNDESERDIYYNLREDSDLLFPLVLFRPAFDTEMIPVLSFLYGINERSDRADSEPLSSSSEKDTETGHGIFRQFVHQVWNAHPEVF